MRLGSVRAAKGGAVSFIVGLVLFVIVIGYLDARLPWPKPSKRKG
jgi:hypothetical protein